jgi:hypothetical protein
MITASVTITEPTPLNMYMANLHDYLGTYCFISGAFVIEDDDKSLQSFLFGLPKRTIRFAKSHTAFQNSIMNPIYECDIGLSLICSGCDPTDPPIQVTNLKWYPFQQSKPYVYLKMEGYPTFNKDGSLNSDHANQWINRHIFRKSKKNHCLKRREDCASDGKCLDDPVTLNHPTYTIEGVTTPIVESHTRKGDEFFVPFAVSQYFLKNGKKMAFTLENDIQVDTQSFPIVKAEIVEIEGNGGKMLRKRMPYTIRKLPNRPLYSVKGPGRTFAKATTLKNAKAQVRLLYMIDRRNAKGTRRQK